MGTNAVNLFYLVTIVCFVLALKFLSSPATARHGNWIGAFGMAVAIVATLFKTGVHITWEMPVAAAIGSAFGLVGARRVKMTAMPQMVALFNGVGGGAAALVALAEFHELAPAPGRIQGDIAVAILLSALIGSISFSGSLIAFA
jgi:NAD(P) transhydrogenase subunit beta